MEDKAEYTCFDCVWCETYDDINGNYESICLKDDSIVDDDSKICKKFCLQI
jgi:hypothetical protein